ncbi:MAG: methyltransferase family protein [Anaerolineae bacterium]
MTDRPRPCLAWTAMGSTMALVAAKLVLASGPSQVLRALGIALLLASPWLYISPFFFLGSKTRPESMPAASYMDTAVVADRGPYALVRHPQYLGYMILGVGLAMLLQRWWAGLLAAVSIVLYVALSLKEEHALRTRLGASYTAYARRVPRFNLFLGLVRWARERHNR